MDEERATLINLLRQYNPVDIMQMLVVAHGTTTPDPAAVPAVTDPAAVSTVTDPAAVPAVTDPAAVPAVTDPAAVSMVTDPAAVPTVTDPAAVPTVTDPAAVPTVTDPAAVQRKMWSPTLPSAPNVQPIDFALRPGGTIERTLASYGYDLDGNLLNK